MYAQNFFGKIKMCQIFIDVAFLIACSQMKTNSRG